MQATTGRHIYVIDTSVLLSDPRAMTRFKEHEVVLPIVVIAELEKKRHDPELGYFARSALRYLDDLRAVHGLAKPIPVNDEGGTLRIELDCTDFANLPSAYRLDDNDTRILSVAAALQDEGAQVTVVSKDLPMRVKASSFGISADEYRNDQAQDTGWTGICEISCSQAEISDLYRDGSTWIAEADKDGDPLPANTGIILNDGKSTALGRVQWDGLVKLIKDPSAFGIKGRSAEQKIALDMLLDPSLGIVSMGGKAGTGKSALALCAGLEAVLERQEHEKVIVFRPMYSVGGQDLGFLPGTEAEKMAPWAQAVFDALGATTNKNVIEHILEEELLEVLPLTHIRGRSLHDAFVIVDEAQSLERNVLLTVLSRIGQNSKVVLTHDVAQRDNLRVGRHDGITAVVEKLKGHRLFGHVTLTRSERSEIAELVTDLLDQPFN